MCDDVGGVYDAKSGGSPAPPSHFPLEGTWCRHHSFTPSFCQRGTFWCPCSVTTSFCWRETFWCTLHHHDLLLLEGSWWYPCSITTSCWNEAGGLVPPAPSRPLYVGGNLVVPPAPSRPPYVGGKLVVPLLHHDLLLEGSWWCPCSIMTSFCWREAGDAPAPS